MTGGPTVRPAVSGDARQLAEIYNETVAAGDATMDLEPRAAAELAHEIETLGERERTVVLAEGESILGWVKGRFEDVTIMQLVLDDVAAPPDRLAGG